MKLEIRASADFEDLPDEWQEDIQEEVLSAFRFYSGRDISIEVVTGE